MIQFKDKSSLIIANQYISRDRLWSVIEYQFGDRVNKSPVSLTYTCTLLPSYSAETAYKSSRRRKRDQCC